MSTPPTAPPPAVAIARDILRLGVDCRLPTTLEYQSRLGVGSGTVQKAIGQLRESGAVELVSRGHLGTYITALDPVRLWRCAAMDPVHVLLPPAGPLESLAVASGLADQLARYGASTTIGYRRGAGPRLTAVDAGEADIAVMSEGAATDLADAAGPVHTTVRLGPGTYYSPGSLVVVGRTGRRGIRTRVGIDPRSSDHRRLTHAQFDGQPGVEYLETDFTHIPRAILQDSIDTGVWHTVDSLIPLDLVGLDTDPLDGAKATALEDQISGAVLAARADSVIGALLTRIGADVLRADAARAYDGGPDTLDARLHLGIR